MTSNDGLLVAFLVKDNEGVSPGHRFPQGGIIARHRREENSNPPTGYFPSEWIIEAIREHENILETHVTTCLFNLMNLKSVLTLNFLTVEPEYFFDLWWSGAVPALLYGSDCFGIAV